MRDKISLGETWQVGCDFIWRGREGLGMVWTDAAGKAWLDGNEAEPG